MFKFTKVRDVLSPTRGTNRSVGIDFYMPKFNSKFIDDLKLKNKNIVIIENKIIQLLPQESALIPSGIKVKLPENYFLNAFNKSGISSQKHLSKMAETVDEDYQGELHISILNAGRYIQYIEQNEKIIQFVLLPASYNQIVEVNNETELYDKITERGENGFGSTNKKEN